MLAVRLAVKPSAAQAYLRAFRLIGVLDKEGFATLLGKKWASDFSYEQAKLDILHQVYPEHLIEKCPPNQADPKESIKWFKYIGLAPSTARNKAATYAFIANSKPGDSTEISLIPTEDAKPKPSKTENDKRPSLPKTNPAQPKIETGPSQKPAPMTPEVSGFNVNIQIHVDANTSKNQIETIFASMQKHLRP